MTDCAFSWPISTRYLLDDKHIEGGLAHLHIDLMEAYVGSSLGRFFHDFGHYYGPFAHSWNRG